MGIQSSSNSYNDDVFLAQALLWESTTKTWTLPSCLDWELNTLDSFWCLLKLRRLFPEIKRAFSPKQPPWISLDKRLKSLLILLSRVIWTPFKQEILRNFPDRNFGDPCPPIPSFFLAKKFWQQLCLVWFIFLGVGGSCYTTPGSRECNPLLYWSK